MHDDFPMLNDVAFQLFQDSHDSAAMLGFQSGSVAEAQLLDAGINTPGSLRAGIILARLCVADQADIAITAADSGKLASNNAIYIHTDQPLRACLGAQYAGWPIESDDFFAMGSGPMRLARGREDLLVDLGLSEQPQRVVGVLESDRIPSSAAIELIAGQCGVSPASVYLAIAPTTSIAGSVQVVARSVETALHKLHELKFEVRTIIAGSGIAPLPPPARPGDTIAGIGRTNDAMLYGATVTLWVDHEDDAIESVAAQIPSGTSADHGQPFAKIFERYDYDFYKVDPLLFSPAVVTIHNLRSGRTWSSGAIESDVLRQSFHS